MTQTRGLRADRSVVVVLALIGASCSATNSPAPSANASNDPSPSVSTINPVEATAAEAPPVSLSRESSTDSVVSTSSATPSTDVSETTSTTAALDSVDPQTERDTVVNAISEIEGSWGECLRTLPSCDASALLEFRTGTQAEDVADQVALWNQSNYSSRNVESREHEILDVRIDGATAEVDVCQVDASVLFIEAGVVADQPEIIVDDDWLSTTQTWNLVLMDGEWRAQSAANRIVTIGEEQNQCSIGSE